MQFELSNSWYWLLLGMLISYLLGCYNSAVVISKIKHKDIRDQGSGNPGTMNMTRTFGLKVGAINFFSDALKGAIPVLVGYLVFKDMVFSGTNVAVSDLTRFLFGISAVIGHIFPVTMKFKGGKGIATTLGLFWCSISCEKWWLVFVVLALLIGVVAYILFCEWGSMGSLIGVSGLTVLQSAILVVRYQSIITNVYVIVTLMLLLGINLLTWIAHKKNLIRLMAGEEHRTSVRHKKK